MKKIFITLVLFSLISCGKDLYKLNVDQKHPVSAPGEFFFSSSVKNLFDIIGFNQFSGNGLLPTSSLSMGAIWVQQVTQVTYMNMALYFYRSVWSDLYTDVLANLNESYRIIGEEKPTQAQQTIQQKNRLSIIEILKVQTFVFLVDNFGNIPYTDALDYNKPSPKYDDAHEIYKDLLVRLNKALNELDISGGSFGNNDPIYNGDVSKWKRYGNSLKLKIGIHLIDFDFDLGSSSIIATAGLCFTSNNDNALLHYQSSQPNTNPLWLNTVLGNRKDVVIAKPFIDSMNLRADPRRGIFFTTKNGQFVGGASGKVILFDDYSNFGNYFRNPQFPGILLDYASVEFFLAEAAERSIVGVPDDAEKHYNAAIKASFDYYGVPGLDDYLARPEVRYSTANGTWKEKIGVQKWIALFNQGFEAWTEYRRLDFPVLSAPSGAFIDIVPVRSTYPIEEQTLNRLNYESASAAIGGDLLTTKIFWDVN